ncbi:estradiol 17-beta-dehydrogenase 11 [Aspergillus udagawae]|nr:estradiol 17-beta-dehydrogenase 11 [Aspergillus udagawae]
MNKVPEIMAREGEPDPDVFVKADAFTKKTYRDVYSAIDPTRPNLSQKGKVVVITGASRGLGRYSFAASFARAHADAIVLLARSRENLSQTEAMVKSISPSTKVLSIAVDVTDYDSVKRAFDEIIERLGIPQVLVNNAGVIASQCRIVDDDPDFWWRTQEVNVRGTFNVTQAFLKIVGPSPAAPTAIINLTSAAGHYVGQNLSSYCLTKLAITQFTAFLKDEHPQITSVSLHPGMIPTDMGNSASWLAPFMKDTADLCGGTAVWLSSGDRQFLSGRYVAANWDVEELEARKEEIIQDNLLTVRLNGRFGE